MPQDRENNYHSEEAQEILGHIPPWTIRWGITVIFSIFAIIILGCCVIKYPERVNGTVVIRTLNAPVDVVFRSGGNLEIISVSNGDVVKKNDILGVINTGADYKDILLADSCLLGFAGHQLADAVYNDSIYGNYQMGDLQGGWTNFTLSCQRYRDYITRAVIRKKSELVREQVDKQKEYYSQMQMQFSTGQEDLQYEEKNFVRDSSLFVMNVVSEQEFDESARRLLQARNSVMSFKNQMTSTELSIIQLEQQLVELSIQAEGETLAFEQEIRTNLERLSAEIQNWKLTYLLTAPINGKVSFVHKWDVGQFVNASEHYLTIVPDEHQSVIGIVHIPQASFGKVDTGQKVNVKLEGYPYMEYGMLVGTIGHLSSVPEVLLNGQSAPQYTAEILFENGMKTTYGRELRMIQKMDGSAEIITEERSLIMRFLDPVVALFKNGI